jgi:hypothetical protein
MGASNVAAAFARWAGKVPPLSMQVLVYMALVSKDGDREPWYGQGQEALAEAALGRRPPIQRADVKAVERAVEALAAAGAITTVRKASVRRDGRSTAKYRLNIHIVPHKSGDVPLPGIDEALVDNRAQHPQRPPENGRHVPRNSGSRPPENGLTSPEIRGTEEYEEYEELVEEEMAEVRTAVTAPRTRDAANNQDPISSPPPPPPRPPSPPGRCDRHPDFPNGVDSRGRLRCTPCTAQGRTPEPPHRPLRLVPGGAA